MENDIILKHGDVDIIQEGVQSLLDCVNRKNINVNLSSPSIYMVPSVIRDVSARSFSPQAVSIGLLHKDDENVQAFEKWKECFLIDLLNRIDSPKQEILELCMQKVYASMEQIKACYDWTKTYNDAEVAKMIFMDACFILESVNWYSESDKSRWGIQLRPATVLIDLILLENQIPFFFLDEIYKCTISRKDPNCSLIQFIYLLLVCFNIFEADIEINNIWADTIHHILSLLHECYKPHDDIRPNRLSIPSSIPSATDLDRAGVNFKPCKDPTWVMGIKVTKPSRFSYLLGSWGKPTLRMPTLTVSDNTELVLRNLIAFEQSGQTRNHITSYVWAMDMLVDTEDDVAKLVRSGVLNNQMGSNQEVATILNNLGNGLVFAGFFYIEQWKTLYDYCNGYWPKHIAWLRRTYFGSPWSIIALLAGISLFALTVIQTIFTIKST